MNHHPAHSPLPVAPMARAAVVRLRDGTTLGARVVPRIWGTARWIRCQLLTEPSVILYVAADFVVWTMWVTDAVARRVAALHSDAFLRLALGDSTPAAPADPSTAPPPAAEVLDADLLEPLDVGDAPRLWLAVRRPPPGDRFAVAPAEWASAQGAILPEVRSTCVAFQVVAAGEGRVRAAAERAGLALVACCAVCGWTHDLSGARAVTEGVCSACRAGEGEPE